jgi:serine/threonine protein kinase
VNADQDDTWVPPGGEPEWLRRFDELVDLPDEERSARLAAIAVDQPDLAHRLQRMFDAEEGSPRLLSRPVLDRAPGFMAAALAGDAGPETPGELAPATQIGPYRLLDLLGKGGMGEVYRAERADGVFEQRVALKLVKRGMDSAEILRRFHRERQILARLEHPGIARILDGGTAPDGRPYFVLELVEGEPILDHCQRAGSSLEERLRLIIAACEAVDAAHRNLVVHRDIKPSNLLVSTDGQIKLLDFGIAKLLAPEGEEREGAADWTTLHEQRLLTPAYAAPEQLLGEPITTATDVYTLGVILYELLTGRSPHPRNRTLPDMLQEDGRETVERPSALLRRRLDQDKPQEADTAMDGISDPRRFARRLQGDLDTIVLTALRRDPARRYRSAADLASELQRFLEGRPIQARPDSVLYRSRKLVLRHKLATAAILAAVLSLVGGLAVSLRQADIARAQAQRAERVKELLVSIFREADAETGQGPTLTAREILDAGARRLETELDTEPEVQAELLDAVAQIERSLGLYEPAQKAAEASLARRQMLFGPDSIEAAQSLTTLAEIAAYGGRLDEGMRLAEQALPAIERLYTPESRESQRLAAVRVILLQQQGKLDEALAIRQEIADATRRRFGPGSLELGRSLVAMAGPLSDLSRFEEAEKALREGLSLIEASPRAGRLEAPTARRELASLLDAQGRDEEAARQFAAVLDLQRKSFGPDHIEVALTLIPYGFLLTEIRRNEDAEKALREAIRILKPYDHYEMGSARRYLAFCLMFQGRYAEAEQEFVEVERFLRTKVGDDSPLVWGTRQSLGWAMVELRKLDEAERTLSEVVAHYDRVGPESNEIRTALKFLGEALRLQERPAEALVLHRRALAIERKLFATEQHAGVAASKYHIALDLLELGGSKNLAEARQQIDQSIAYLRPIDPDHPQLHKFLLASGSIALAEGDRERARRELTEAVTRIRAHRGPDHPLSREAEALLQLASSP